MDREIDSIGTLLQVFLIYYWRWEGNSARGCETAHGCFWGWALSVVKVWKITLIEVQILTHTFRYMTVLVENRTDCVQPSGTAHRLLNLHFKPVKSMAGTAQMIPNSSFFTTSTFNGETRLLVKGSFLMNHHLERGFAIGTSEQLILEIFIIINIISIVIFKYKMYCWHDVIDIFVDGGLTHFTLTVFCICIVLYCIAITAVRSIAVILLWGQGGIIHLLNWPTC